MKNNGVIVIEGHVQGLSNTRSLGKAGISVIVVDTGDCIARHSRYCRGFYKCPSYDSEDLANFLIELTRNKSLKGWLLLPSNDHVVLTLARNKKRLEEYYKVITPCLEIIKNIYDKSRLLHIAEKTKVPYPSTFYAQNTDFKDFPLSFPVLTRGRFGLDFYKAQGRKAFLANDLQELHEQLTQIKKNISITQTLTQELIPDDGTNKTVSFCAFCVNGEIKVYWMGEKLREHPIRFGTATFARSVYIPECFSQSVDLLHTLDYTGVCEVEYLKDPRDGQYKLIEINARTWLWVGLAKACGVDFAKLAYEYVHGINSAYSAKFETDVYWMNPFTDSAYTIKAMLKGQLRLREYARSMVNGRKVNALFAKGDWKPGFVYLKNIFSYLRER
jgi:D-aspartate ligase